VSPTELNRILRQFFAEVKTNNKTDLTRGALTGIRAAIHRTTTGQPISRSINILKDVEFTQANKMFEVVCKSYYKRGNPKPQHKNPIEAGDMEKLNSYFSNDCQDKLQEFVWFNFCYYLGRRGREGWRELTKNKVGKLCYTWKNAPHLEKFATTGKVLNTWKNATHLPPFSIR